MQELKYNYYYILQGDFGYGDGFEDLCQYNQKKREDIKEMREDLKAYRLNSNGRFRIIKRRELNPLSIKNHVAFVNGEID